MEDSTRNYLKHRIVMLRLELGENKEELLEIEEKIKPRIDTLKEGIDRRQSIIYDLEKLLEV